MSTRSAGSDGQSGAGPVFQPVFQPASQPVSRPGSQSDSGQGDNVGDAVACMRALHLDVGAGNGSDDASRAAPGAIANTKATPSAQAALRLRHDQPRPAPAAGEALLRVRLAGVCGTDLAMLRGYAPFQGTLGHEFVAEVASAPDAPHWVGERVVGDINIVCGHCPACLAGRRNHCERRSVIGIRGRDGAFADYLTLPLENLHPVPACVSDEAAVFTEPLAAALEIMRQVQIAPDQRVLVVGAGRLGQLIARVLRLSGCDLSVVARRAYQRALLAAAGIHWLAEDAVPAGSADLVVEASGARGGLVLARHALRPAGTLVLKSTYPGEVAVDLAGLVVDEITVVGSRCGPFPAALRLLEQGLVDPTPLIDECRPLSDAESALRRAAEPGVLKVLMDCRR